MTCDYMTAPWQKTMSFVSNPFRTADDRTHILLAQRATAVEMTDTANRKARFLDRVMLADVCLYPDGHMEKRVCGRASYRELEAVGAEIDSLWADLG